MKRNWIAAAVGTALASAGVATALIVFSYYRWASAPAASCTDVVDGGRVRLANQPIEWSLLDDTHEIYFHERVNGVDDPSGPYDPPNGTGSNVFGAYDAAIAFYPFHWAFQIETRESGTPIYESAITASCSGAGPTTAVVIQFLPTQNPVFYRWAYAPPVECIPLVGSVLLRFTEQPHEWINIPDGATKDQIYATNGDEATTTDIPLPPGDGSFRYAALGTTAPAYPIHYAVAMDTKTGGTVRYRSVLVGVCTADGAGTSAVYNVPEPANAALASAGSLVVLRRRRSGGRHPARA